MSKTIRITAILGLLMYIGYIFFGKIIIPAAIAMFSGRNYFLNGSAVGMYVGVQFIGFIPAVVFIVYSILALVAANSDRTGIGMEISGLALTAVIHPILAGIVAIFLNIFLYRGTGVLLVKPNLAYTGYTLLNTYSSYLNTFGVIARFLLVISLVVSACRKKTLEPIPYED